MRFQVRVTPGAVGLIIVTGSISPLPNSASRTVATAVAVMQWAHGYSGCMGVSISGIQVGSVSVAALLSMSPLRIAVIGRQKSYANFASNTAIYASAPAMCARANNRAFSTRVSFLVAARVRMTGFHAGGPVMIQNRPTLVCSAVRLLLLLPPISLISL